jgi:hypothetical protein
VFEVQACGQRGSAFIVQGIPGVAGDVVVTAKHVVAGCSGIELRIASCEGWLRARLPNEPPDLAFMSSAIVHEWPELDLVAFPVTRKNGWSTAALQRSTPQPEWRDDVLLLAVDNINSCPRGQGTMRYTTSVARFLQHVTQRTSYRRADLGDLGVNTTLLVMASTGVPGNSGGAVLNERMQLVGMYQGGGTHGYSTNWAVRLSVPDLRPVPGTTLGGLSGVRSPSLAHSALDDYATTDGAPDERATGALLAAHILAVADFDQAEGYGLSLGATGYTPSLWRSYGESAGFFASVDGTFGEATQVYLDPFRSESLETYPTAFWELKLASGLGGRLFQQDPFSFTGFAGYHVGLRSIEDTPSDRNDLRLSHGPLTKAYGCMPMTPHFALCLVAGAGASNREKDAYRYTLESRASPVGAGWIWRVSAGVALAWSFWEEVL